MKNTLKRLGALLIAAIMMIAMCVPVMADPESTPVVPPSTTDRAVITVKGVDAKDASSATVKAYRIVYPEYNSEGLVKYTTIDGVTIADGTDFRPTSEEVTAIASGIIGGTITPTTVLTLARNNDTGDYVSATGEAGAGEYIVLITGTNTVVYNPALVSVNYTDANDKDSITNGTVNLGANFAYGNVTYVKKSEPNVDKSIVTAAGDKNGTTVSADGDNTTPSDTINFKITADIPSYKMSSVTTTETHQVEGQDVQETIIPTTPKNTTTLGTAMLIIFSTLAASLSFKMPRPLKMPSTYHASAASTKINVNTPSTGSPKILAEYDPKRPSETANHGKNSMINAKKLHPA